MKCRQVVITLTPEADAPSNSCWHMAGTPRTHHLLLDRDNSGGGPAQRLHRATVNRLIRVP